MSVALACELKSARGRSAMEAGSKGKRLVCDRDVGVSEYMGVLNAWMGQHGTRDLVALLQPMHRTITWKQAPRLDLLLKFASLYGMLFEHVQNTVASHRKLSAAITSCHVERPCIFTTKVLSLEVSNLSTIIRMGAAKWREIKVSQASRRILFSKAVGEYEVQF